MPDFDPRDMTVIIDDNSVSVQVSRCGTEEAPDNLHHQAELSFTTATTTFALVGLSPEDLRSIGMLMCDYADMIEGRDHPWW